MYEEYREEDRVALCIARTEQEVMSQDATLFVVEEGAIVHHSYVELTQAQTIDDTSLYSLDQTLER